MPQISADQQKQAALAECAREANHYLEEARAAEADDNLDLVTVYVGLANAHLRLGEALRQL